jgi:predicted RND superfamily exporter protein
MQNNVAWRPLIDFLYSEDGTITIIDVLVDGDQGARDFSTLKAINEAIWASVDKFDHMRPDGVEVHVNGLSTGLYQYLEYSFYWLRVLFIVSAVVGSVLMFAFTRSFRATLAFLVPMLFTTTWFLGLLPIFGILVGMSLILPIIFITSIGSDYAAHLSWNILKTGHPSEVYETTGKAILFSAITDFGAFFIFSFSHLRGSVRDVALATCLAIIAIFVVTMLVVPLFFNREVDEELPQTHILDNP